MSDHRQPKSRHRFADFISLPVTAAPADTGPLRAGRNTKSRSVVRRLEQAKTPPRDVGLWVRRSYVP